MQSILVRYSRLFARLAAVSLMFLAAGSAWGDTSKITPDLPGALRSALAAPLETPARVLGVLSLYRRDRDAFSSDDLGRLISFGSKLARVLNRCGELVEARS